MVLAASCLSLFCSCGGYDAHIRRGEKYLALGEYYDASEEFKAAYRVLPAKEKEKRGQTALKMANCYYKLNSPSRAIAAYRNAIRYNVTDSLTSLRLGQMLMMNGSYREAGKEFTSGIEVITDSMSKLDSLQLLEKKMQKAEMDASGGPSPFRSFYPADADPDDSADRIKARAKAEAAKEKRAAAREKEREKAAERKAKLAEQREKEKAKLKEKREKEKAKLQAQREKKAQQRAVAKAKAEERKMKAQEKALAAREKRAAEKEKAAQKAQERKDKAKAKKEAEQAKLLAAKQKAQEKKEKAAADKQAKIDKEAAKQQEKLDKEAARLQAKKEKEAARLQAEQEKAEAAKAKAEAKIKAEREKAEAAQAKAEALLRQRQEKELADNDESETKQQTAKETAEKKSNEPKIKLQKRELPKKEKKVSDSQQPDSKQLAKDDKALKKAEEKARKEAERAEKAVERAQKILERSERILSANDTADRVSATKKMADQKSTISLLQNGLESSQNAQEWKEEGSEYIVRKATFFNSRRADYSPMLLGDQSEYLYFTSTRNEAQGDEYSGITGMKCGDIFFSQKDDKGVWSKPEAVEGGLNTEYDEGAACFSPDGKTMYLTQCSTDPDYPRYAQIMTSQRSDASWSQAKKMEFSKDTLSSFAHPAVSPDGQWLYFVSDMPGGKGGLDIWRIRLGSTIGGVENLGEPVNTPGDEMFPAFRPNGDFYFSSNGHPGLGGQDIFIATIDTTGHYVLEHPGYPLNSSGDDFGMTFEGYHNRGFFSSNRGDGKGWDHLYTFEKEENEHILTGWVYEMEGDELPNSIVYLVGNDGTNMRLPVKSDGSFTQLVEPGVDYVMLATCKGHLNHKEELRPDTALKSNEYVLQFPLPSISVPVMINNIFYDYGKATLRPESAAALDKLVTMLEENPNITIELSAHTDYHSSDAFNDNLSQQRAISVCNYLVEHGIVKQRLTPKGYGKHQPKTITKKMAEKTPWLAEGTVLTEEYITSLKDQEKQDFCDQINRRTEFRVLRTTYGILDEQGHLRNEYIKKQQPKQEEDKADNDWLW